MTSEPLRCGVTVLRPDGRPLGVCNLPIEGYGPCAYRDADYEPDWVCGMSQEAHEGVCPHCHGTGEIPQDEGYPKVAKPA